MSNPNQASLKEQLRQANKLIIAQRYKEARKLLEQIDHPQARVWLEQLENKQKQPTSATLLSPLMIMAGVSVALVIVGIIVAIMYAPRVIEALQANRAEAYTDEFEITEEEIIYSHLAGYCYHITGYGGELCLDWTDSILEDFHDMAVDCITSYLEIGLLEEEDYIVIGDCLREAGLPAPL